MIPVARETGTKFISLPGKAKKISGLKILKSEFER